jgi:hypothetical protein
LVILFLMIYHVCLLWHCNQFFPLLKESLNQFSWITNCLWLWLRINEPSYILLSLFF